MCPRCGGHNIVGPLYVEVYGIGRLRYVCAKCGFSWETDTKDAKQYR